MPSRLTAAPGRGLVTAAFPDAAELGADALRRGGNAVDAICAAAWALAVCEPAESGLGGQAVALIAEPDGRTVVIDGSSRTPRHATRSRITKAQQHTGRTASTVPSAPAALDMMQRRFGRLDPADSLRAAADLADTGFRLTRLQARQVRWTADALRADPLARSIFFDDAGAPRRAGSRLGQPTLARTLRRLADAGVEDFYHGDIARTIAEDMAHGGGLIDTDDLRAVRAPDVAEPIETEWAGRRALSAPPPAGGATVLLALALLERWSAPSAAPDLTSRILALCRATRTALRERERWPDHPDDLTESIRRWIVSRERVDSIVARSRPTDTAPPTDGLEPPGDGETTHLCAVDRDGRAVSLTLSIQSVFGAKTMCQGAGFFYNNYLTTCPRSPHPYRLGPGAAPRANASPTILLQRTGHGWTPELAIGAAGSRRLVSAMVRTLDAVCLRGASLPEAVRAPRCHALLTHGVWIERPLLRQIDRDRVVREYGPITPLARLAYRAGAVQALQRLSDGRIIGAADPRRDGAVASE